MLDLHPREFLLNNCASLENHLFQAIARWWIIIWFSFVIFNQNEGPLGLILCIIHVFFFNHYDGPSRLTFFFSKFMFFLTTVLRDWHFFGFIHVFPCNGPTRLTFLLHSCFSLRRSYETDIFLHILCFSLRRSYETDIFA